ncbi:hypothetical protein D9M70_378760 [compost metagenome]
MGQEHQEQQKEQAVDNSFRLAESSQRLRREYHDTGPKQRTVASCQTTDDGNGENADEYGELAEAGIDLAADQRGCDPG